MPGFRMGMLTAIAIVAGCASTEESDRIESAKKAAALYKEAKAELQKASLGVQMVEFMAAVNKYEEVLRLEPTFVKARAELGEAWFSVGAREEKLAAALSFQRKQAEQAGKTAESKAKAAEFDAAIRRAGQYYESALRHLLLVSAERPNANVYWQISDCYFFFENLGEARAYLVRALRSRELTDEASRSQMEQKLAALERLAVEQELELTGSQP